MNKFLKTFTISGRSRNAGVLVLIAIVFFVPKRVHAQVDENELGAWYMYFFNTTFNDGPWGVQGDIQYRNWNAGGDLEQLLIRGGITYTPENANIKLTLGYGNVTTGTPGSSGSTTGESRIYQEALFSVRFGNRIHTTHRFRYEQRFVEEQDFRTRYRYNLFLNVPLNSTEIETGTVYLALYNELFMNGQQNIGDGRTVEVFDRNRFYAALGYVIKKGVRVQGGMMRQSTENWNKNQLQFSLHHTF
ncbi:MAG: DUF2490 domain-containing protein [Cyclobacteriaceae bacterium]